MSKGSIPKKAPVFPFYDVPFYIWSKSRNVIVQQHIAENTLVHVSALCCALCTHHSNSTHDCYYFNLTCDCWTTERHLNENVTNRNVCRKTVCFCGNSTHSKRTEDGELRAATKMNECLSLCWGSLVSFQGSLVKKYPGYRAIKLIRS